MKKIPRVLFSVVCLCHLVACGSSVKPIRKNYFFSREDGLLLVVDIGFYNNEAFLGKYDQRLYLPEKAQNFNRTQFLVDSQLVFGLEPDSPGAVFYNGYPAYYDPREDELRVCKLEYLFSFQPLTGTPSNVTILAPTSEGIINYDLFKCRENYEYMKIDKGSQKLLGASVNPQEKLLVYALSNHELPYNPEIFLLDLETGETQLIGHGFSPMWNHSGNALAYVTMNELVIYSMDGDEVRIAIEGQQITTMASPNWSYDDLNIAFHDNSIDGPVTKTYSLNEKTMTILSYGGRFPAFFYGFSRDD